MSYPAPIFNWIPGLAKSMHPKATYTRASTGSVFDSSGILRSAASGLPRFGADPLTGLSKGFLVEESRANLFAYSEQFNGASWQKNNTTVTANSATAPDGAVSYDTIVSTGTAASAVYRAVTVSSNATVTASVFAKQNTASWIIIEIQDAVGNGRRQWFNLSTGVKGSSASIGTGWAAVNSGVENVASGYRVWSAATAVGTTVSVAFYVCNGDGLTASSVGASVDLWGAQLEAGSFPTSYIPTTTASATRAADVCTVTLSNLVGPHGEALWSGTEGTLLVNVERVGAGSSSYVLALNDGSYSNLVAVQLKSGNAVQTEFYSGGGLVGDLNYAGTSTAKVAVAFKVNDMAMSVNGGTAVTDSAGAVPVSMTTLSIGRNNVASAGGIWNIRQVTLWNRRLSNADLQAITA